MARGIKRLLVFRLLAGLPGIGSADCFNYRPNSKVATYETIEFLKETPAGTTDANYDRSNVFRSLDVWVPANGYAAATITSTFRDPAIVVMDLRMQDVIVDSHPTGIHSNWHFAEVHISGRDAHAGNRDGFVRIFFTSQASYMRRPDLPTGRAVGKAYVLAFDENRQCNAKYLPFQGGSTCDPACAGSGGSIGRKQCTYDMPVDANGNCPDTGRPPEF